MVRIWAKTIKNHKILASYVYENIANFNPETFYLHVQEICHKLDIPTPIVLGYHIQNYIEFNNCTFTQRDFVESVHFDKLVLEEASIK